MPVLGVPPLTVVVAPVVPGLDCVPEENSCTGMTARATTAPGDSVWPLATAAAPIAAAAPVTAAGVTRTPELAAGVGTEAVAATTLGVMVVAEPDVMLGVGTTATAATRAAVTVVPLSGSAAGTDPVPETVPGVGFELADADVAGTAALAATVLAAMFCG